MNIEYIRRTYGVPAKVGGRVRLGMFRPDPAREATIVGAHNACLRVRLDGEKTTRIAHPTWRVEYLQGED